jgi:hypothetical protein
VSLPDGAKGGITVTIHSQLEPVAALQPMAALFAQRIEEHKAGQHTPGNMRRDCPLCVEGQRSG